MNLDIRPGPDSPGRGKAKATTLGCAGCHPGAGRVALKESSRIAGQHRDYLVKQLRDFRDGRRTNDGGVMRLLTQSLTDADIDDLSNYFAGIR